MKVGTFVKHLDGSKGVVLPNIGSVGAGEDTTGAWSIPVAWYEGWRQGTMGFNREDCIKEVKI
jgi:hypothetical protein